MTRWLCGVLGDTAGFCPEPQPQEAPDPEEAGPGVAYRCRVCDWHGRGPAVLEHHREAHHEMELTYAPGFGAVSFSCCPNGRPNVAGANRP